MRLSPTPDLSGRRTMVVTALVVMLVVGVSMLTKDVKGLSVGLGDTDDATRLVMVRNLIHGAGWYDQLFTRLQPPQGVYMHWSRLVDGGLFLTNRAFALFTSDAQAETLMRMIWPLLWIFPAALATLAVARRFGGGAAVFAAALVLFTDGMLYAQFHPGRIDHHDVQITFCMIALAGAVQTGSRRVGPMIAGIATALGLAVGLEALAFNIIIGASFGLRMIFDPREGKKVQVYGATVAATSIAAFLIQTPPTRWGVAVCDAMGVNTVAGLGLAGVGLVLAVWATQGRDWRWRLVAAGLVGAVAVGAFLWIDPNCLHGPFAEVDPRIRPFWLNNVQEVLPVQRIWRNKPAEAVEMVASFLMAAAAWGWLGFRREFRESLAWPLMGVLLGAAIVSGLVAVRMENYAQWFAAPLVAAAAADIAYRFGKNAMLITAVVAIALSPIVIATAGTYGYERIVPPKPAKKGAGDHCFRASSYVALAKLRPVGVTLTDIDLGPFVVAHTPHSALSGPYHRLGPGIMASRNVLIAPADSPLTAQAARDAGATFILDCKAHAGNADRSGLSKDSLQARLDAGKPPAWLKRETPETEPVQVFRILPAQTPSRAANASTGAQAGSKT